MHGRAGRPFRQLLRPYHDDSRQIIHLRGGDIRRYDSVGGKWETLPCSTGSACALFAIHNHLYSANRDAIFEIADDGKTTRTLASTRRNPPQSNLDKLGNFGRPV